MPEVDLEQIYTAIRNADKAGDTESVLDGELSRAVLHQSRSDSMAMIDVAVVLRLDEEQVRALGLDDALKVGDECQMMAVAKVTKVTQPIDGPGTVELKLTKVGVSDVDQMEEPMKDYAKRRNVELREG